jgi:8-oxo-dGTP pyrophosphatase MutT (NUDIX family)
MKLATRRAFSVAVFCRRTTGADVGKVLLIRHKRLGTWLPVGGELKDGETPLQAAERELREETGLSGRFVTQFDAVDGAPSGLMAYEEHPAGTKGTHLNFCFVVDVDDSAVRPNEEFDEFCFVDAASVDALSCPTNVCQLVKRAVSGGRHGLVVVARRWLDAFNARDLDGLVGLYAEDAVHVSPKLRDRRPETNGEITGREALRAWWSDAFVRLPHLRYEERRVVAEGKSVFLEYTRVVPGEPDLIVAELYVMNAAGQIERSHVFHG